MSRGEHRNKGLEDEREDRQGVRFSSKAMKSSKD